MDILRKAYNGIEKWLCVFLISIMLVVLTYQMFCRLASVQNVWTDELGRYLYIWLVYLSAGLAMYYGQHIRIDILHKAWPKSIRKYVDYFGILVNIVFCGFILYGTTRYTFYVEGTNQVSGSIKIPMYLVYAAVNVGFLSIILRQIQKELIPKTKLLFLKTVGEAD